MNRFSCIAALSVLFALGALPGWAQTLTHQYTFNTDASDSVGGANGTLFNGASISGGRLLLDGVDDYVQLSTKIVPTSGSYSVSLFARQTAVQSGYTEFISQGFSGGPGFYIGTAPGNGIRVTDSWQNTTVTLPNDFALHHYALTVNATTNQSAFYFDGVLRATMTGIATTTGGTDTRFGNQFAGFSEYFRGELDDIRVYNGALSAGQVTTIAAVTSAPEPDALLLTACGAFPLLGVLFYRRRKVA